jgi:hypothetical protein
MLLSTRKSHESRRRETDVSHGYLGNPVEVVDGETVTCKYWPLRRIVRKGTASTR